MLPLFFARCGSLFFLLPLESHLPQAHLFRPSAKVELIEMTGMRGCNVINQPRQQEGKQEIFFCLVLFSPLFSDSEVGGGGEGITNFTCAARFKPLDSGGFKFVWQLMS